MFITCQCMVYTVLINKIVIYSKRNHIVFFIYFVTYNVYADQWNGQKHLHIEIVTYRFNVQVRHI